MIVTAEFQFEPGKNARIIYDSIVPELHQDYQRTKTSITLEGDRLALKVEADDIVSVRAALNGWLRLIKITDEICSTISDTQVINQ